MSLLTYAVWSLFTLADPICQIAAYYDAQYHSLLLLLQFHRVKREFIKLHILSVQPFGAIKYEVLRGCMT